MPKPSPQPPVPATGDAAIIELVFEHSTLPIGRQIDRHETLGELGYEWLDYIELLMDAEDRLLNKGAPPGAVKVEFDHESIPAEDGFAAVRVEEFIAMVKKLQAEKDSLERIIDKPGECRAKAPASGWPITDALDFCGEWTACGPRADNQ